MSMISLKYRIYPTKAQEHKFVQTLETCRQVYNWMLSDRELEYQHNKYSLSYFDQNRRLTVFKQTWKELQEVNAQVLEDVSNRIDKAFKSFFRRVKAKETPGYPRFKNKESYNSFTYRQKGFELLKNNKIKLSKIGSVKINLHRPIQGDIKTCIIVRQNNKWFCILSCEFESLILPKTNNKIGIDMGLEKFASYSDGSFIENPRFFRKSEQCLAKANRNLSKQVKGSKERIKAKKVASKVHEKIKNQRSNFAHKLSRELINTYDIIVTEKLNVEKMVLNHRLSKSISDASWNQFISYLMYKAEWAGRKLITVNPAYTSQDCSGCNFRAKKPLKERWHFCPYCGLSIDRDTNAAINILRLGLQSLKDMSF